ncbi:hypothetical protein D3C72_1757530 [compost metagenome]
MAAHALYQVIAGQEQLAALLHQQLTGGCQVCLSSAPHHQVGVQTGFQFFDVQTDRGRRQVQRLRRGGERAQVCDGNQRLQLVKVQVTHQIF